MHLLKRDESGRLPIELSLTEFIGEDIPAYAILSHTWVDDEEVTFKDVRKGTNAHKRGYQKLLFCAEKAARHGYLYFWVDTCCIDKRNAVELQEALNSMFRWYHRAARCYVYMSDVSMPEFDENQPLSEATWLSAFRRSRWFTRGWTLQELLAPQSVEFFSREGTRLGDKKSLEKLIHEITGIAVEALRGKPLSDFDENERMSWARRRRTRRDEDAAYSLLGIFDIHMPLLYGEGRENALARLQREIQVRKGQTIKTNNSHQPTPTFAPSPLSYSGFEPSSRRISQGQHNIVSRQGRLVLGSGSKLPKSNPANPKVLNMSMKLEGHSGVVRAVAFSPDGKLIVSASDDETVRLWDSATGTELSVLKGHSRPVRAVVFSPDGKQIVSASLDHTVRLWNSATGAVLGIFKGHSNSVWAVTFSPDDKQIVSASSDRTVRLWDSITGEALGIFKGHTDSIWAVTFSPDGKQIASASSDRTVRLWDSDLATDSEPNILKGHLGLVVAVVFSPDGKQIASASLDQTVRLWNSANGAALDILKGHTDSVWVVTFSPDGKQIASASSDRTVRLWDSVTGEALGIFKGHTESIWVVTFSPDGKQIASASSDHTVRLWDSVTGEALGIFEGHSRSVWAVTFSPDGKQIASVSEDKMVRLWDSAPRSYAR